VDFDDDTEPEEPEAMELGERERVFEVEWRRVVGRVDGPIDGEAYGREVMTVVLAWALSLTLAWASVWYVSILLRCQRVLQWRK
jgi:hypothetical protein